MTVIDATVALVTLEDARAWMKFDPGDTDAILMMLINSVSAHCAKHCGRTFIATTHADEKYDGDGTDTLILRKAPVNTVTKVISFLGGQERVQGPDKDYVFTRGGLIKLVNDYFPKGLQNVTVSYTAGYALAAIPHDLRLSILQAISFTWNTQDKRRDGITSVTTTDGITTYTEDQYPKGVMSIWNKYQRKGIRGYA